MDPQDIQSSVTDIHESLINRCRVAYAKKKYLATTGDINIGPSDNVLTGIKKLQDLFNADVVSSSLSQETLHISIQDKFMRQRLLDKDEQSGRAIGGILTDSTYSFFKAGYLTSSSVYCRMLRRWVPILFTYTESLTKDVFKLHFGALISIIVQHCHDDREVLLAQVKPTFMSFGLIS